MGPSWSSPLPRPVDLAHDDDYHHHDHHLRHGIMRELVLTGEHVQLSPFDGRGQYRTDAGAQYKIIILIIINIFHFLLHWFKEIPKEKHWHIKRVYSTNSQIGNPIKRIALFCCFFLCFSFWYRICYALLLTNYFQGGLAPKYSKTWVFFEYS